jgi:hypothetical protein
MGVARVSVRSVNVPWPLWACPLQWVRPANGQSHHHLNPKEPLMTPLLCEFRTRTARRSFARASLLLAGACVSLAASAQGTAAEQACASALQGRVAWNQQGNTAWAPDNIRRLCQGTNDPAATVACFEAEIRRHNDWSRGISSCQSPAAPASATGRNAVLVVFGQGGQRLGQFRQAAPRVWIEGDNSGTARFRFEETQRDDWSVYLLDRSRGVNLQLDLHTRKVMYSEAGGPRSELYDILSAYAGAAAAPQPPVAAAPVASPPAPAPAVVPVTGRNVAFIGYGPLGDSREVSGLLQQKAGTEWHEMQTNGTVRFRFEEVQRDDWSVYLVDRSRGVNLQLDLHTRRVMYSQGNGARSELYQILRTGRR